jgi:predicted O-methyltransferase YrrM
MTVPQPDSSHVPLGRRLRRLRRAVSGALRSRNALDDAKASGPLRIATKTYNTDHPHYEPELVRNFPDRIQNAELRCDNPLLSEIRKLARRNDKVPRKLWRQILTDAMAEARTVPGFDQVMERKDYIESYLGDLGQRHGAHYLAGWVNMSDAQFLYWIVRQLRPRAVLQTGVSNGLSSAFMMLALAKNGAEGRLHLIDVPAIFNPGDPAWTRAGTVYGFVIPEAKSSGWMIPDQYRDRCVVEIGDAKELLPAAVDRLDRIDIFYHDSDHTYDHMTFEFEQAWRKLAPAGVVVADDISWNASLWEFADRHRLPSFNYFGSMGIAFNTGVT